MVVAAWLSQPSHKSRKDCKCAPCCTDRMRLNCYNPHKCAVAARTLLNKLEPKWDLRLIPPDDGLDLNELEIEQNEAS
ncbi:hypothetical protein IW262DRAFT_1281201 [Armillaria fumosa]|nr:hypothetical protein IW262DRAFT_1281201 [Armillaria fumosa]